MPMSVMTARVMGDSCRSRRWYVSMSVMTARVMGNSCRSVFFTFGHFRSIAYKFSTTQWYHSAQLPEAGIDTSVINKALSCGRKYLTRFKTPSALKDDVLFLVDAFLANIEYLQSLMSSQPFFVCTECGFVSKLQRRYVFRTSIKPLE